MLSNTTGDRRPVLRVATADWRLGHQHIYQNWHGIRGVGRSGALRLGWGHKPRTVGLDATAFGLIDRWRSRKADLGLDPRTTPLFCTLRGGVIAVNNIGVMLKRRAAKAGIDKRVHIRTAYGTRTPRS